MLSLVSVRKKDEAEDGIIHFSTGKEVEVEK